MTKNEKDMLDSLFYFSYPVMELCLYLYKLSLNEFTIYLMVLVKKYVQKYEDEKIC